MATSLKLSYGLRGQQLLHIGEVANGLACDCVCPGCGARLVARNQGKLKVLHFAYYKAPECAGGLQTALHLAAKEIFLHHGTFLLPEVDGLAVFRAEHFEGEDYYESFDFDIFPLPAARMQSVADAERWMACVRDELIQPFAHQLENRLPRELNG